MHSSPQRRLVVHGFPSAGGGAGTELRHQIRLWRKMDIAVVVIPSSAGTSVLPEHAELKSIGVDVRLMDEWNSLRPGDIVLSFCNNQTLKKVDYIIERGALLIFINCMTELFGIERAAAREGKIAAFGYQNPRVRRKLEAELRSSGCPETSLFFDFEPWLDPELFPFHQSRNRDCFVMGHISRPDPAKFSKETVAIYEAVRSPLPKSGIFLGFNYRCATKIGPRPDWIETHSGHLQMAPVEFYRQCHVVLQPTDTNENWPRIGLEAMASGTVLIVDDRGGWQHMIEHGRTGFLCSSAGEFAEYATMLAHDPALRAQIARQAHESFMERVSYARCAASWARVMELLECLPGRDDELQAQILQITASHAKKADDPLQAEGKRQVRHRSHLGI